PGSPPAGQPAAFRDPLRGRTVRALALAVPLVAALGAAPASAEDMLKVAIGQINNWENQAPTLGQDVGIFKKRGLGLETVGTAGAGETLQPVIAGSADLGHGVGAAGAMRAFSRGAPIRILLPAFTGTGDLYWYVKADSPIKSLKDATPSNTIAYSTSGSSSNNIVVAFVEELGTKAKPTATGSPPGTLTAGMSGPIDIGWGAPPVRFEGNRGGQDPHRGAGQRRAVAARADRARPDRQCRCVEDQARRHHALRRRLSRGGGLDVFRPQGDQDVRRQDQEQRGPDQEVDRGVSSQSGDADRRDAG